MSNNKQSSVTELYNKMMQYVPIEYHYLVKEEIPLEQYEAMHKEEVVDFAFNFYYDFSNLIGVPFNLVSENKMNAEFYYDKVFGGNNEQ